MCSGCCLGRSGGELVDSGQRRFGTRTISGGIQLIPKTPKIYHILHVDRLASVLNDGCLYSDKVIAGRNASGTMIGLSHIKSRRLHEITLSCYPDVYVGDCVPFYFCPRSVMLYLIDRGSAELGYQGGQRPVIHLQADLKETIDWAEQQGRRWAFTSSNAGSYYFKDSCLVEDLPKLPWEAIQANQWAGAHKEGKQSEFLLEAVFPWSLVECIGVYSEDEARLAAEVLANQDIKPTVKVRRDWYY